jgi:hypothetical protein
LADPEKKPRSRSRSSLFALQGYQHRLAGYRIDIDACRRRQAIGAAVGAQAGTQVKSVTVPWATQDPPLRQTVIERPAPMRTYRAMRDDLATLERQDAERGSVDL